MASPVNHNHANSSHQHQNASASSSSPSEENSTDDLTLKSQEIATKHLRSGFIHLCLLKKKGERLFDVAYGLSDEKQEQPALFATFLSFDKEAFLEEFMDSKEHNRLILAQVIDGKIKTIFVSEKFEKKMHKIEDEYRAKKKALGEESQVGAGLVIEAKVGDTEVSAPVNYNFDFNVFNEGAWNEYTSQMLEREYL